MDQTYSFIVRRGSLNHLLASSMVLILVVNACVDGLLVGAVVVTLTGAVGWAVAAGAVAGLAWIVGSMWSGYRGYREAWRRYLPRRPTQAPPAFRRD